MGVAMLLHGFPGKDRAQSPGWTVVAQEEDQQLENCPFSSFRPDMNLARGLQA